MNVAVCSLKGVSGSMCKHHIMNCKLILGLPHGIYIYIYINIYMYMRVTTFEHIVFRFTTLDNLDMNPWFDI